jgi:hypothetical protein
VNHHDHLTAYLEGDPEAIAHVRECALCGAEAVELDAALAILGDAETWIEPSADLEERVVAAVVPPGSVVSLAERRQHRFSRRRLLLTAVAACLVGMLVATAATLLTERSPSADVHVALSGSPAFSGASASGDIRDTPSGVEIKLTVRGLPRAADGTFYEAWVKRADGILVPIGTFHTGDGVITLWSGVPLNRYPTLTVTLEDEDGNQASSGRLVLSGSVPR